ncbi:MAG: LysR family transcriptional regulator, partial [Proteobacteria bacterium]|nr:LysR family transcriptional regulator [Pseudomonadota bacterium]
MNNVPWNLIKVFLTVVKLGSLSAAAKELGCSQPKLTRDIKSLESYTQLNLFKRSTQGVVLTESGQFLVESAQKMNECALSFNRKAAGLSTELSGDIRISVNEMVGLYLLPPVIAEFHQQHPSVNIEIVISNQTSSINKREADIALRMFRPTQPELVVKRLPNMPLGFYAHKDYIKRYGIPENFNDIKNHTIIGFDESTKFIDSAQSQGTKLERSDFKIRTDNILMQINLANAGIGIVATHKEIAKKVFNLQEIMEWVNLPELQ